MDKNSLNSDPITNENRIKEVARLRLHESQADDILNEYVKKAAEEFGLPIGLVSIVLDGAQTFAASHGIGGWMLGANGTPIETLMSDAFTGRT